MADEEKMTLSQHIEELRQRLLRAVIGIGIGMAACLAFGKYFFEVLFWPLWVGTGGHPPNLYFTSMTAGFVTYFKICLIVGAVVASPYAIYQIWQFVASGLRENERKLVRKAVLPSTVLFLAGVTFFFVVIAPIVVNFLLGFAGNFPGPAQWRTFIGEHVSAIPTTSAPAGAATTFVQPWLTLDEYISFITMMCLVFGLAFQMPVVVVVLARTGIVPIEKLRRWRKYAFFVIVVVGGIISPAPDLISNVILAGMMYLLYELGLAAVWWQMRPKAGSGGITQH
jgi:sec-independent protein translocase protein TatC